MAGIAAAISAVAPNARIGLTLRPIRDKRIDAGDGDDAASGLSPPVVAAVGLVVVLLSVVGGGFSPAAVGAATAGVWGLVVVLLLGDEGPGRLPGAGLRAASWLAALAALSFLSMSWAGSDGPAFTDSIRVLGYLGTFAAVLLLARPGGAGAGSWLAGLGLGGGGVAAIALAPRLLGIGDGDAELVAAIASASGKLSQPIGYWNALGSLMAIALAALVWTAAHRGPSRLATVAAAATPLAVLAIYLTSSRGAALAAAIGVGLVVATAANRRRALRTVVLAIAGAAGPAAVFLVDPEIGLGGGGLEPGGLVATLLLAAGSTAAGRLVCRPPGRGPVAPLAAGTLAVAAAITLAGVVVGLGDPDAPGGGDRDVAELVSGSGRGDFWATALDAATEEPLRGVGAGGWADYWNANGSLTVFVANAHSALLETLAELGVPGLVLLLGFLATVGFAAARAVRAREGSERAAFGALAAVALIGLVGIAIDWNWEVPAALVPAIIAAALLCAGAPSPAGVPGIRLAGAGRLFAAALGAAAVAGGGLLALSSLRLEESRDSLRAGDVTEAARAARTAASLVPFSAEPPLLLAEAEVAAGNLEAARRRAEQAARLAPRDYRSWLLLAQIHLGLDNREVSTAYAMRAFLLAPRVLGRAVRELE